MSELTNAEIFVEIDCILKEVQRPAPRRYYCSVCQAYSMDRVRCRLKMRYLAEEMANPDQLEPTE